MPPPHTCGAATERHAYLVVVCVSEGQGKVVSLEEVDVLADLVQELQTASAFLHTQQRADAVKATTLADPWFRGGPVAAREDLLWKINPAVGPTSFVPFTAATSSVSQGASLRSRQESAVSNGSTVIRFAGARQHFGVASTSEKGAWIVLFVALSVNPC